MDVRIEYMKEKNTRKKNGIREIRPGQVKKSILRSCKRFINIEQAI